MIKRYAWPVLTAFLLVALAIGTLNASRPVQTNEQRVTSLASQIRCPTCAGLSSEQSESPLAQSVKVEIAGQVAAGRSDKQIKAYFVSKYGDSALMTPKRSGFAAFAWILPILGAVFVTVGVVYAIRRWGSKGQRKEPTQAERNRVNTALEGFK